MTSKPSIRKTLVTMLLYYCKCLFSLVASFDEPLNVIREKFTRVGLLKNSLHTLPMASDFSDQNCGIGRLMSDCLLQGV